MPSDDISYSAISGFRLDAGFFGDSDRRFGLDVNGFYTQHKTIDQFFSTSPSGVNASALLGVGPPVINNVGLPLLARPFIDTTTGPTSLVVTNLGEGVGSADISTSTSTWRAEASAVWNVYRSAPTTGFWWSARLPGRLQVPPTEGGPGDRELHHAQRRAGDSDLPGGPFGVLTLTGFRILPVPFPVGGTFTGSPASVQVTDRFTATNRFNGGTSACGAKSATACSA